MRTIQQTKDAIAELYDSADAVLAIASREGREPTDEDKASVDAKLAEAETLKADLARLERLEDVKKERAKQIAGEIRKEKQEQESGQPKKPVVPATAKKFATLKAFRGQDVDLNAYCSGQWILANLFKNERAAQFCRDHGVQAAMSTGSNMLGGATVPDQFENAVIDLREERGVFRRFARVRPMTSDTLTIPRRTGGLTAYYVADNAEITASDKGWDSVTLVAKKLAVLAKWSSELNEDSVISMADDLASEIAYAFANAEDTAGFLGDGTSTYGGIVGVKNAVAAGSKVTAITGNTAFSTLDLADFESMVGKLPLYAQQNARWFISKAGWAASMLRLVDAAGGNTIADLTAGATPRFLGYDVVLSQVLNSTLTAQTSTTGLCYFGDLSQAASLGARRGVDVMVSDQRYMEYDQLAIKGTERYDIVVHETGDASNPGSILALVTPAS